MFGCLSEEASDHKDVASRYFVLGLSRFEKELNIDRILKTLRDVKVETLDKDKKAMCAIAKQNVIEVDSDDLLAVEHAKNMKKLA